MWLDGLAQDAGVVVAVTASLFKDQYIDDGFEEDGGGDEHLVDAFDFRQWRKTVVAMNI
jgi:hypothetical protein